jgi:transcription elongation factor GreA
MKKIYQLTSDGKKELEQELATLVSQRGSIADKIANARDYGDLSENAEYDAAREEQSQVESRIAEIEQILQNTELIVSGSNGDGGVALGSTVTLKVDGKEVVYTIVGPVEADPLEGKISNESPLGKVLLGKKVDEVVEINTPKGVTRYKIVNIK